MSVSKGCVAIVQLEMMRIAGRQAETCQFSPQRLQPSLRQIFARQGPQDLHLHNRSSGPQHTIACHAQEYCTWLAEPVLA